MVMNEDKRNEAKEYLSKVRRLDALIDSKQEDITYLTAQITKTTSSLKGDVVSNGGGRDRQELLAKLIDLRDATNQEIDRLIGKRAEVSRIIEQVKNPNQMRVLKLVYIGVWDENENANRYLKWREVAERLHKDEKTVQRIHGRALQSIEKILKGVPKCP